MNGEAGSTLLLLLDESSLISASSLTFSFPIVFYKLDSNLVDEVGDETIRVVGEEREATVDEEGYRDGRISSGTDSCAEGEGVVDADEEGGAERADMTSSFLRLLKVGDVFYTAA